MPEPPISDKRKATIGGVFFALLVALFLGSQSLALEYKQSGDRVDYSWALKEPPLPVTVFSLFLAAFALGVPVPADFITGVLAKVGGVLAATPEPKSDSTDKGKE